jgi:hypothetical protein
MRVWVNVWGTALYRRLLATALAACSVGCIDDFDNPKGYGPRDGSPTYGKNGYTCSEFCERNSTCDDGGSEFECRNQCEDIADVAQRGGCSDELDDLLECLAELPNICTQQDACYSEVESFSDCISEFCALDPGDCPI